MYSSKKIQFLIVYAFLIFFSLNSSGQSNCYEIIKDNSGFTDTTGLANLETASCLLIEALPEQFRPQFKVFSTGYYLHVPKTEPGFPPVLQLMINEIEAASPYYLLFAKESSANSLYQRIVVVLKLPDHELWECLAESDQEMIQGQLQSLADDYYKQQGNLPEKALQAEKHVVDKLKQYIIKVEDCCPGANRALKNSACFLCPDSDLSARTKAFFENEMHAVKIPIFIEQNGAARPDNPAPGQRGLTLNWVDDHNNAALIVKFRNEDDTGFLEQVLEDVLSSDYFEDIDKKRGFISSDLSICLDNNLLETIKTDYENITTYDVAVWGHIWMNTLDPSGAGYLYVAARTFDRETLEANNRPDILGELNKSFSVNFENNTGTDQPGINYTSKFVQSASVVFATAATSCMGLNYFAQDYPTLDYSTAGILDALCSGSVDAPMYFISPAGQPILIGRGAIPRFSVGTALEWKFHSQAMHQFTTGIGVWNSCGVRWQTKPYEHIGYFNFSKSVHRYKAIDLANAPSNYDVYLGAIDNKVVTLTGYPYTPPSSRPVNQYANGPIVSTITGLGATPNAGVTYSIEQVLPQLKALQESFATCHIPTKRKTIQVGEYTGVLVKVLKPSGSSYDYYVIYYDKSIGENKWKRFNCGNGQWNAVEDPFASLPDTIRIPLYNIGGWGTLIVRSRWWNQVNKDDLVDQLEGIPIVGPVIGLGHGISYLMRDNTSAAIQCFAFAGINAVLEFGNYKMLLKGTSKHIPMGAKSNAQGDALTAIYYDDIAKACETSGIPSADFKTLIEELHDLGDDAVLLVKFSEKPKLVKAWKGLSNYLSFRTNHTDLETVLNYYNRTGKTPAEFADELFTDPALIRSWLDDQANNIYRFTSKQIDSYVLSATKQNNQSKVMLGMYDDRGPTSYIVKAGNDHTYFDMGAEKWNEAKSLVNGGINDWNDEMWEINKRFIDDQRAAGKEFWFSHDPFSPQNEQFFAREVNYLIDEGVSDFIKIGDLWKAIW